MSGCEEGESGEGAGGNWQLACLPNAALSRSMERVLAVVNIQLIVLVMDLKDLEWAIIGVLQWTTRSIMANVNVTGGSQGVRLVSQVAIVVLMCSWQDGAHVVSKLVEEPRGCLQIRWLMGEELSWNTE